ncbi:hypothetical protein RQP46_001659 [Phenoliferia psychrophenolica]
MALPGLPNEILLDIISLIPSSDHATLRACQLTSRTFHELSSLVLYGRLDISWTAPRGLSLLAILEEKPSLAALISSVKVDYPRFEDLASVKRRYDERIAQMWAAEERTWPSKLDPDYPEEDEYWTEKWADELSTDLAHQDEHMWDEAEDSVWGDFVRNGSSRWLDPPQRIDYDRDDEGRWKGGERLEDFLTSLPNLRRLDFTTFYCGIPILPHLTSLTIENRHNIVARPPLPDTPNIEELTINGYFRRPSESLITPRFPRLHTLRILQFHSTSTTRLIAEILEISRLSIKTLSISIEVEAGFREASASVVAESLAPVLSATPGLQTLSFTQDDLANSGETFSQVPLFLAYLAESSLRDLSLLPFLPSHLLFASLPATIERLASQTFRAYSTPVLYQDLHISWLASRGLPLLATLEAKPPLADRIVSLKVDLARFDDFVQQRYDERVAQIWKHAEEHTWPARLDPDYPDEDQYYLNVWEEELSVEIEGRKEALWEEAEEYVWDDLIKNGNSRWLDPPMRFDDSRDEEGRWLGHEQLESFLALLLNLRRLDITNYDGGFPPLPHLEFLALENHDTMARTTLPDTPNIEELVIDGDFRPPSESATPPRFPKLYTLRIQSQTTDSLLPLLPELLEISKATLKTLEVTVEVTPSTGQPTSCTSLLHPEMAQVPASIPAFLHAAYIGLAPAEQQQLASTYAPPPPPPAPTFESTEQVIARTLPTLMALISRGSATQVVELRDTLSGALQLAEAVAAAKARMPFPHFPNEILLSIISFVPPSDHATLRACQLTSHAFREYSTPVLYDHLHISWIPTCGIPLIATLGSKPSLSALVKSVTVNYPDFQEAGQVARRRKEIIARRWIEEQRRWSKELRDCGPEETAHWEAEWYHSFDQYLDSARINDEIWEEAEEEARDALVRAGNYLWLDHQDPMEEDGRWEGGELLAGFLASLSNLRRLDFTNYDCGIPTLPNLTHLTLRNKEKTFNLNPPHVPETPNVEELVVDGTFGLPPDYRLPRLHTLRVGPIVHILLLSRLLDISRNTITTLQLRVDDTAGVESLAEILPHLLAGTPGLETLSFSGLDHATLRACQLTSRTFNEISTPILYRHLHISWLANRGLPLLATLESNSALVSLIVSVKVDFPRFEDVAQLKQRHDEIVARAWEVEEADWPDMLDNIDPEERQEHDFQNDWYHDFKETLQERDEQIWEDAAGAAWIEFTENGNARWLRCPGPQCKNYNTHVGRLDGNYHLYGFLESLPNLRRLDYTNFDSRGIPTLPRLTFLSLKNQDEEHPSEIPSMPNIEELIISRNFHPPPRSATPRLPKLNVLRIHSNGAHHLTFFVPEVLEMYSKTTLKTLEVTAQDNSRNVQRITVEVLEVLAPALRAIPGLENLFLPSFTSNAMTSALFDQTPAFVSYLATSSLRDVSLPVLPSPLLFASLPASIERISIGGRATESEIISALDSLLLEKSRLPHLVLLEVGARGMSEASGKQARVEEQVLQGRLLGLKIVLR